MNDSLGTKNPSIDSPCFQKPSHAFTIQNQHNLNQEDERVASSFSNKQKKEPAQIMKNWLESHGSFQSILRLSLNSKVEKMMFSEESLLAKNIKFREEKEFIESEICMICQVSFQFLKIKHFCKVCGISVCSKCSTHKVYRDKVLGYKACDLCFLKLLSKEQEIAWKDYFSQKDSIILSLNAELKKFNEQNRKPEKAIEEIQEKNKKERTGQEEKIRELEINLCQEMEIFDKRAENYKRNQATLKTERDILKDLESAEQKLRARISMMNIDISQKNQKLANEENIKME